MDIKQTFTLKGETDEAPTPFRRSSAMAERMRRMSEGSVHTQNTTTIEKSEGIEQSGNGEDAPADEQGFEELEINMDPVANMDSKQFEQLWTSLGPGYALCLVNGSHDLETRFKLSVSHSTILTLW